MSENGASAGIGLARVEVEKGWVVDIPEGVQLAQEREVHDPFAAFPVPKGSSEDGFAVVYPVADRRPQIGSKEVRV